MLPLWPLVRGREDTLCTPTGRPRYPGGIQSRSPVGEAKDTAGDAVDGGAGNGRADPSATIGISQQPYGRRMKLLEPSWATGHWEP